MANMHCNLNFAANICGHLGLRWISIDNYPTDISIFSFLSIPSLLVTAQKISISLITIITEIAIIAS